MDKELFTESLSKEVRACKSEESLCESEKGLIGKGGLSFGTVAVWGPERRGGAEQIGRI
jgi:hypothetical protein